MSETKRRLVLYCLGIGLAGALLFVGFGITVPPDPSTRLNGASFLAGVGDFDGALAICDTVLEEHPGNIEARIYRATFLAMAERYDDALAAYNDVLDDVEDEEMRRRLEMDRASILLRAGRREEFRRERDRIAQASDDYRAPLLDGLAAETAEDWDRAVVSYGKALERNDHDDHIKVRLWNSRMSQGRVRLLKRDFEAACESFGAAHKLFPKEAEAMLRTAEVRLAMDQPDLAIAALRPLGPQTPGVAPLVFRSATQLLKKGRRGDALDALDGALAADEEGVRALVRQDPAWQPILEDPAVVAILETKQVQTPGGLPAQR